MLLRAATLRPRPGSYAALQRTLALRLSLVLALSLSLAVYLCIIKQSIPALTMLNLLRPTFILPSLCWYISRIS
jgi:hypothetical protein